MTAAVLKRFQPRQRNQIFHYGAESCVQARRQCTSNARPGINTDDLPRLIHVWHITGMGIIGLHIRALAILSLILPVDIVYLLFPHAMQMSPTLLQ